jgi:protein tyrosine phosphatase (PTP) superfamily phosphohydrolase (DUF442 family)
LGKTAKIIIICLILLIGSSGCAYVSYVKDPFVDIPNFHQVNESLYRGGRPNDEGWQKIKQLQIKTVISLCGKDENTAKEEKLVLSMGMDFVNIPLSIYKEPREEQVLKFLNIVTDKQKQPVFVHCDSGRDRTGAIIAMYRVVVESWKISSAYNEAKSLGFWPYRGDAELKKFIHQLKDKKIYFETVGREID